MLRSRKTKRFNLLTLAASVVSVFTITAAAQAQESHDGTCTIKQRIEDSSAYRFDIGNSRYDYPTYSEERFPEFDSLREAAPRYRDMQLRRQERINYLSEDDYRSPRGQSQRTPEWEEYHDQWRSRQSGYEPTRSRDNYAPARSRDGYVPARERRDYRYSGFDYSGDSRSRPVEDRFPAPLSGRDRNLGDYLNRDYDSSRDRNYAPARDLPPRNREFAPRNRDRAPGSRDLAPRNREPRNRDRAPRGFEPRRTAPQDRYEPRSGARPEPTLDQKVTARYSDPTTARFAMSLGSNQGIALFREVSSLIDQRHLSPKSYTERIQNGVRNIEVALQNRAFRSAVSLQASNTQLAGFRSGLSQLTNRTVSSRAQAEQVVGSAMQLASQSGLRPGLVAYEFTNASIQSLDKYSGLDPSLNRVSGAIEDTGIQTAMGALDEYTTGVGIEVRHHAQGLEIVRALRGGPAVAAGIQSGDIIRQINGQNIGGMEMNQSVNLISGPAGAAVRFLVAREGRGTKTFSLVRRQFRIFSVNDVKMVDRQAGVGYMHLNKFAKSSAAEMEQAIQELRSQGMKNLIVDVRGNPGGLLTTAIEVSDKFLRCGKIVATRGRLGSDNMVESASANGTWSMPLVVLVDGDSASASEIFAAAIQENGRGIVVGEKSYGKGTVQTHFPLSSGLGTVRLTTAKFYSPTDREMSGAGVTPDVRTSDEKDALDRAVTAASHPRLAEMVAQHGTCRPAGSNFGRFGSAAKPATDVSALLSK